MTMKKKQVAIIHFNTPELTEAAILSLRKQTGMRYDVTVFDNSDRRPFTPKMEGVTVVDNTKGQVIDFEKELEKYPTLYPIEIVESIVPLSPLEYLCE